MRRTFKGGGVWALFVVLWKLFGPSEILCDNRGVVQAWNKGEVDCISAGHIDTGLWMLVWKEVGECIT